MEKQQNEEVLSPLTHGVVSVSIRRCAMSYDVVSTLKRHRVSAGVVKYGATSFGEGE